MVQLIDIHGNPLKRDSIRESQTAKLTGLHREFASHPAKGLTPARLANILLRAEQGDIIAQHELFMDMEERDAHLFSEMSKRKRAVLVPDWSVEPPRNASAAEKADAEYANEVLADMDNIEDLFLDLLDGIGHGFSAIEMPGWSKQGGEWLPNGFEHRPQTWFQLANDNQNELRLRGPAGGEELTPGLWIMHRAKARSGYIARTGLYRVLVWPYIFKNYATSDLAEMLEIYGLPIRIGKYPPGTAEDEKTTLLRAVAGLGHSAAGIIPTSMSIDFEDAAEGQSDPFMAMMRYSDDAMSKAILGGTLTSNTSASGGGAHALGNVHNEVRKDLRDADCKQLADTISRDLIWPLVTLNRPGEKDARRSPRLKFDLREPEDLTSMSRALPAFVSMGMQIPQSWAHDKTGIPVAAEGEPVLQAKRAAPEPTQQAALARIISPVYRDQQQLDDAINNIPPAQLQAQSVQMLKPLVDAINNGASETEVMGMLMELLPDMDETALADTLHKAMFAADVWGRLFAAAERVN